MGCLNGLKQQFAGLVVLSIILENLQFVRESVDERSGVHFRVYKVTICTREVNLLTLLQNGIGESGRQCDKAHRVVIVAFQLH